MLVCPASLVLVMGIRRSVAENYKNEVEFVNLTHPSATFGRGQRELVENLKG